MDKTEELEAEIARLKTELAGKEIQIRRILDESDVRYGKITAAISDYVYSVRVLDGRVLSTRHGDACVAVTGYTSEDFVKDAYLWYHMVHEDDRKGVVEHSNVIVSRNTAQPIEHRIIRKDGKVRWVRNTPVLHFDDAGTLVSYEGLIADITELKSTEAALQNQQRLESLGLLAGGIAHDFNNLLAGVFGYIDLAQEHVSDPQTTLIYLTKAMTAFDRARALTQQLLTFSKGGIPVKKTVNIGRLVQDAVGFVLSGSNVRAQFSLAPDLLACDVDENQIGQVIDNIVINAQQAMPQGGVIKVSADNRGAGSELPVNLAPGEYVRISIQDYGTGIPPEHLEKIYDPFFTTKQKGSGLGLATSYSIIRKHGGHIAVESVLGKGTVFHLYLPAVRLAAAEPRKRAGSPGGGSGRVLVMDDEPVMRDLARIILETSGFSVEVASDGAEAVDKYMTALRDGRRFDAVILDLTIPGGMGGKAAIAGLLAVDPTVCAIVSSGYSDDPVVAQPQQHGFRGVVPKPYTKNELVAVLKGVLGQKGTSV